MYNLEQVVEILEDYVQQFASQKEAADSMGISYQYLSDALNGRRKPGEAILKNIGLRRIFMYEERIDNEEKQDHTGSESAGQG